MEFKLNKIDTDIRKKMQEEIKDDKVHSGKSISVKKDLKDQKNEYEKQNYNKDDNEKRCFTIEGTKYNNKNINIQIEKVEEINEANSKGRILDATK